MGLPHREDCQCCEAARARIVEITQAKDRENADLNSYVAKHKVYWERAQAFAKDFRPDWAGDPWKSQQGQWFNMTSENTRMAVMALMERIEDLEAQIPAPAPE